MNDTPEIGAERRREDAPGTVLLDDKRVNHIVLNPPPSDDPNDPLNWPMWRKLVNYGLACTFVMFTFVLLDNKYVALGPYQRDIGISYQDYNNSTALGYAGLAVGCIFFMPFVHRYGRRPIYLLSSVIQLAVSIWYANMTTTAELYILTFFAAIGGAVSEAIVMVTIADMFFVHQRAKLNGFYLLMQSTGAFLGPVMMGYVIKALGWRFMWWLTVIMVGTNMLLVIFFFEESKWIPQSTRVGSRFGGPSEEPAAKSATAGEVEQTDEASTKEQQPTYIRKSYRQRMALITPSDQPVTRHIYQPFLIFFSIFAVAYASVTYGSLLAWMAATTSCQSYFTLREPYNLDPSNVGLLSLGPFAGQLIASVFVTPLSDWSIVKLARRNGGVFEPEMRLWLAIPGAFISFAGLLAYGMSLSNEKPLMVLVVSYAIYCVGFMICATVGLTYMLDSYQDILGDSMIAVVFLRNAISVIIMFAFTPWITNMGVRNAYILISTLGLSILLVPVPLIIWGKKLRIKSAAKYRHFAVLQVSRRQV